MSASFIKEKEVFVEMIDRQFLSLTLKDRNWLMDVDTALEVLFQMSQTVSRMEGASASEIPCAKH